MNLRVIEGGLGRDLPASERPVVWNRLPRETCLGGRRRVLVIRAAENPPFNTLAVDDGRAYLVGIRDFHPVRAPQVLQAWLDWAKGEGLDVRDERETT